MYTDFIIRNISNFNPIVVVLILLAILIIAGITKAIIDLVDYKKFVEEYYHTKINTNIFKIGLYLLKAKLHQKEGI